MNKPKKIGTAAETAVVKFLRANGFAHAERRALRGQLDAGDITGTPGICWEVKGGAAAKLASDGQVQEWLDDTDKERVAAGADVGILVLQRKGIGTANAGRWWALIPGWMYESLCATVTPHHGGDLGRWRFGDRGPVRMHLAQVCPLLHYAGYGDRQPTKSPGPDVETSGVRRPAPVQPATIPTDRHGRPVAGLGCHICGADPGQPHEQWCPQIRDRAEAAGG